MKRKLEEPKSKYEPPQKKRKLKDFESIEEKQAKNKKKCLICNKSLVNKKSSSVYLKGRICQECFKCEECGETREEYMENKFGKELYHGCDHSGYFESCSHELLLCTKCILKHHPCDLCNNFPVDYDCCFEMYNGKTAKVCYDCATKIYKVCKNFPDTVNELYKKP